MGPILHLESKILAENLTSKVKKREIERKNFFFSFPSTPILSFQNKQKFMVRRRKIVNQTFFFSPLVSTELSITDTHLNSVKKELLQSDHFEHEQFDDVIEPNKTTKIDPANENFFEEKEYFNFYYINMITSHGYQTMSDDGKLDSDLKIVRDIMTDPFGGGSSTGGTPPPSVVQGGGHFTPEDDFDLGPMHMQCMGDEMQGYPHNSYPPPHMMHQQQAHQQAMYQQHHHHHQQMGMQQHWGQQQYMNGGYYDQYNNYGYGQQMYQQHPQMQQQHQPQQVVGIVSGGGPSPGGSHNTPSPNALSESDGDEHSIRNNNVLKRPSPGSDSYGMQQQQQQHLMQQQVGVAHHGHM